jgi:hypothetical protein
MTKPFIVEVKQFQLPEEGVHQAAPTGLYALGTQTSDLYGSYKKILITYELLDDPMDSGEPFTISKIYTRSFSPKSTLHNDMAKILGLKELGEKVDISSILGKNCLIHVEITEVNGKHRTQIKGVMPLDKRTPAREPINKPILFDFDGEIPADCPAWIKKIIQASPEWKDLETNGPALVEFEEQEVEAL